MPIVTIEDAIRLFMRRMIERGTNKQEVWKQSGAGRGTFWNFFKAPGERDSRAGTLGIKHLAALTAGRSASEVLDDLFDIARSLEKMTEEERELALWAPLPKRAGRKRKGMEAANASSSEPTDAEFPLREDSIAGRAPKPKDRPTQPHGVAGPPRRRTPTAGPKSRRRG